MRLVKNRTPFADDKIVSDKFDVYYLSESAKNSHVDKNMMTIKFGRNEKIANQLNRFIAKMDGDQINQVYFLGSFLDIRHSAPDKFVFIIPCDFKVFDVFNNHEEEVFSNYFEAYQFTKKDVKLIRKMIQEETVHAIKENDLERLLHNVETMQRIREKRSKGDL